MSQQLNVRLRGLYTHPDDLSSATPQGALSVADNIVIDREDIASPRRGMDRVSYALSNTSLRLNKVFSYQDYLLGHWGSKSMGYYNPASGWSAYSTTHEPIDSYIKTFVNADVNTTTDVISIASHGFVEGDKVLLITTDALPTGLSGGQAYYVKYLTSGTFSLSTESGGTAVDITATSGSGTHSIFKQIVTPVRGTQANQNFYFTSNDGVKKLDAYNATPVAAGAPKGLDLTAGLNTTTASTWLAADYSVAYRLVWGFKDLNGNLILGAPSQREIITNSGSVAAVDLIFSVPDGIDSNWFYQLYRSAAVDNSTGDVTPNDELGLVYEGNPTTIQLAAASFTFATTDVDTTAETITETNHGLANGDVVYFSSTTTIPAGLTAGRKYYVVGRTANTFQVSAEYGGAAVDISSTGAGTHTCYYGKIIAIQDITPDELRGATLYTANSQEGIVKGNERPPMAEDITTYRNFTFFANTTSPHRFYLTLLGIGSPNGLQNNDTITIDGVVFTGSTSIEQPASGTFKITTAGSASQNIVDTAASLVRVINQYASSTTYAYYLSGPDDLPGKMLLEERGFGGGGFNVKGSRSSAWSELGANNTNVASTNDRRLNGLYYSKPSQPEAVPLTNSLYVGSAAYGIKRIVPLRDSLFIFKEDGIFRLSGYGEDSFSVTLADSTARILAPESAQVLNNQVYVLTDQGVVFVTEAGVQVQSRPIERTLLDLQGVDLDNLKDLTFGISYESERKYILFTITQASDTFATQAYVFNTFTSAWTRWTLEATCGTIDFASDKLYLGDTSSSYMMEERKELDFTDNVDFRTTATISAVSTTLVTINNVDQIEVGDIIYQDSSTYAAVVSKNADAGPVTVSTDPNFATGAVTIYAGIPTAIKWSPITAGNPSAQKQFREVLVIFKKDFTGNGSLIFSTDQYPSEETETVVGSENGGWGLFPWGDIPWGGERVRKPFRVWVPRNKQRANQLLIEFQHSVGFSAWELSGLSVTYKDMSERISNGTLAPVS